jgi:hypothetical protein
MAWVPGQAVASWAGKRYEFVRFLVRRSICTGHTDPWRSCLMGHAGQSVDAKVDSSAVGRPHRMHDLPNAALSRCRR